MPKKLTILPGDRYGRLTIVKETETWKRRRRFLCQCDCGNVVTVDLSKLRNGNTRSCGCLQAEARKTNTRTHGSSKTRLYAIWNGMKERCYSPNTVSYRHYGGRGIMVCSDWMQFEPFKRWALTNGYRDDLTIERKDNDGDYEPDNCAWVPAAQQVNNTRRTITISYHGRSQNLKQWSLELGMRYGLLYKRIVVLGWSPERALTTPAGGNREDD